MKNSCIFMLTFGLWSIYSCLLCLWNIYSCLFLASEIYIYMKSEDGKEEEYVPSGWKFPFTIEICFGFWWWWTSISGILIYIQLLNLKMAKKKKTIQVAGTCLHRKMLHCINKRLMMQLFHEAGYIDHTYNICWGGILYKKSNNW